MKVLEYLFKVPIGYRDSTQKLVSVLADKGYIFRTDYETYKAWSDFSEEYSSSWLIESDETIEDFLNFIEEVKIGFR